jgi:hypothetical protein
VYFKVCAFLGPFLGPFQGPELQQGYEMQGLPLSGG